jgi:hypothetical protein
MELRLVEVSTGLAGAMVLPKVDAELFFNCLHRRVVDILEEYCISSVVLSKATQMAQTLCPIWSLNLMARFMAQL